MKQIDIADLTGDPAARGHSYGRARHEELRAFISDWLESLREAGIADPYIYVTGMLRNSGFPTAIQQYAPELLEEVRGIASGAQQPFELILASQLMDEEWAYRPRVLGGTEALEKCSSVAIRAKSGRTWIGQNMDLGQYTDGHQILLRVAAEANAHGALIFTVGCMIGLMGINDSGVAVCVNSLPQLPAVREGVPVAVVIRKLLQAQSVAEAAAMIHAVPHATGQHYLIVDSGEIRSYEASPAGVVEYQSPFDSRLFHTNHPLATIDNIASTRDQDNTVIRLRCLTGRLLAARPSLRAIKSALSSRDDPQNPVCRTDREEASGSSRLTTITTGSMISSLRLGSSTVDCKRGST
jgi:isopenicillin-N N-acyltransferase like protein